jgi:hypothetical protein
MAVFSIDSIACSSTRRSSTILRASTFDSGKDFWSALICQRFSQSRLGITFQCLRRQVGAGKSGDKAPHSKVLA